MQATQLTKTQLADALGISRQEVHRYAKKGMPCDSIAAARQWREESVRVRLNEPRGPSPAALVRLVHELQDGAATLLEEGRRAAFDAMAPTLRQALRKVPPNKRDRVKFARPVFDALTDDVQRVLLSIQDEEGDSARELDEAQAERMGAFWYAVAAGEIIATPATA